MAVYVDAIQQWPTRIRCFKPGSCHLMADTFEELADQVHEEGRRLVVDLLIRTGKEQRLSDFLLWESAFAELYFPDVFWPDFSIQEFRRALDWFDSRSRRFGE